MGDYILMTDSCCDLPGYLVEQLNLRVLPLAVHFDGECYADLPDGAGISYSDFYRRIRGGEMPSTSAVNIGQYEQAMEAAVNEGKDIVCVCFSGALSTTYQSARIAAGTVREDHPHAQIFVIDSLSASMGQGLLLYLAAQQKEAGLSAQELADWIEANKLRVCHWFTVDDLLHLRKGGRISDATALMGTVLGIKPIMHTDEDGKLTATGKIRGRKQSLSVLVDEVKKRIEDPAQQTMFLCHADCAQEAYALANTLKEQLGVKDVIVHFIGPVIGSHTGTGTIGLFFVGQPR